MLNSNFKQEFFMTVICCCLKVKVKILLIHSYKAFTSSQDDY